MNRINLALIALSAAYFFDSLIGDPRRFPHPVRLIGRFISLMEKAVRIFFFSPQGLKASGLLIVIIVSGGSAVVAAFLLAQAYQLHMGLGLLLEIYILFAVLAGGDLRNHVAEVEHNLKAGKLDQARTSVSLLVSRDTLNLNESGVSRAALESLFENSADGFVAPLFFAAVGGPVGAVIYKAVNTLDSMIGYRNEEYGDLGFFAAKIDDFLNFIPARLTAFLIILAGPFWRRGRIGWQVLIEDRLKHQSPNSAWPEAAAAGVLGISFGGIDFYRGKRLFRPVINSAGREPQCSDLTRGLALFRRTSNLAFFCMLLLHYFIRTWEALPF
ncbi:MAG: adenosylcobinamide-phosphate synthase CbiB [Bacillota bacterium]